jgi:uncharacterized protein YbjT (DUF2867 family)
MKATRAHSSVSTTLSRANARHGQVSMKIVVAGGSGRVGSRIVQGLVEQGHEVAVAAPRHGVDAISGHGLDEALEEANVLVDAVNPPRGTSYSHAFDFFQTTTRNLIAAAHHAGVTHHVLISIVGSDRVSSEYFRGKDMQEQLLRARGQSYSIVRSTTFFEALNASLNSGSESALVRVPDVDIQPVAATDLARVVADVAGARPLGGKVEVAGPERMSFQQFAERFLRATGDPRPAVADPDAQYLGTRFAPGDTSLLPVLQLADTDLDSWIRSQRATTTR